MWQEGKSSLSFFHLEPVAERTGGMGEVEGRESISQLKR